MRVVRARWVCRVGIPGWYREGYTGVLPTDRGEQSWYSEAGPGSPAGAGVGGTRAAGVLLQCSAAGTDIPTLRARSVPCGALPGISLGMPPLGQ